MTFLVGGQVTRAVHEVVAMAVPSFSALSLNTSTGYKKKKYK